MNRFCFGDWFGSTAGQVGPNPSPQKTQQPFTCINNCCYNNYNIPIIRTMTFTKSVTVSARAVSSAGASLHRRRDVSMKATKNTVVHKPSLRNPKSLYSKAAKLNDGAFSIVHFRVQSSYRHGLIQQKGRDVGTIVSPSQI